MTELAQLLIGKGLKPIEHCAPIREPQSLKFSENYIAVDLVAL